MDFDRYDRIRPIRWQGDRLSLLDQRRLPFEQEYLDCGTSDAVARAIHDLVVRGAPVSGPRFKPAERRAALILAVLLVMITIGLRNALRNRPDVTTPVAAVPVAAIPVAAVPVGEGAPAPAAPAPAVKAGAAAAAARRK
jgi:hypothetical protein